MQREIEGGLLSLGLLLSLAVGKVKNEVGMFQELYVIQSNQPLQSDPLT